VNLREAGESVVMNRYVFVFPFLFLLGLAACGVETRTEVIRERAVCTSDAMCNDHDETSVDTCEFASGICSHERERVVMSGCTSTADCDDGNAMTVDACVDAVCNHTRVVMSGCTTFMDCDDSDPASVDTCVGAVCNHSRDVIAHFDPSTSERQDVFSLCERQPSCDPGDGLTVRMPSQCLGRRDPWNEFGYPIAISIPDLPPASRRLQIRPQMRVGDPTDLFRVTVRLNEFFSSPVIVRDMTGHELEDVGIMVDYVPPAVDWMPHDVIISLDFVNVDAYRSRALQWAIPPGGVTNIVTGADLNPCLQVSVFVDVPEHGILRLTSAAGTELPQCVGTVRGPDSRTMGARVPDGLFRTVSDPRLYFAATFGPTPTLFRFDTLRELVDWWAIFEDDPITQWTPSTMCANAAVYQDIVLVNALTEFWIETVGARPGTPVTWLDTTTGTQHYGFADRNWTLLDIGAFSPAPTSPGRCSTYDAVPSRMSGFDYNCWLDLQGWSYRYTLMPTDRATIDPDALTRGSGWLFGYYL
jgi:hypothetical protein